MTQKLFYSRSATLLLPLLLVCMAHSSYSLPENLKLHKQVETAQNAANAIQKRSLSDLNPLHDVNFVKLPRSQKIDPIAEQLNNPDESIFSSILEKRTSSTISPSELKETLKPILKEAFDLNNKITQKKEVLLKNSAEIENQVQSILARTLPDQITSSTLGTVAKQLAQYQARTLKDDVNLISDLLKSSFHYPYIINVVGLLGPGAVLESHMQALLLEEFPHIKLSITQVMDNIKNLHTETVRYVTLARYYKSTDPHQEIPQKLVDETIRKMQQWVKQASELLGSWSQLSDLLSKFVNSRTVFDFQSSLKAPETRAAFEALLIEPWGVGHTSRAMPLGVERLEDIDFNVIDHLARPNSHSLLALENTKIRLEFTSEAEAIEKKLLKHLSYDEVTYLAKLLSENQQSFTIQFQLKTKNIVNQLLKLHVFM